MLSDNWLSRTLIKCDGNGNANDGGDYNPSFALHAVELKMTKNRDILSDMQKVPMNDFSWM